MAALRACMHGCSTKQTAVHSSRASTFRGVTLARPFSAARTGLATKQSRRHSTVVEARYRGGSPDIQDKVLAAMPYLLPFLDSFGYGRFLFYQFPQITRVIAPISPLVQLYASVPFAPLICFFAVYLGIVQNQRWSRFVRFNGMQAMLLDILLILPRLVEQVFSTPTGGWALQAYITAQNTIWIFIAVCVLYGIVSSLLGQAARIPLVADAAEQQVR